jgi:hypothetical protein
VTALFLARWVLLAALVALGATLAFLALREKR